jgi:Response receiver domain
MSAPGDFTEQRLAATREFAHTMIVVDDDAWNTRPLGTTPRGGLSPPRRGHRVAADGGQNEMFLIRHALDTEKLVAAAMDLGLICSVIRPPKGKSIKAQVGSAAKRADIVCLDWELHSDGGDSATSIITEIARSDEKRNGRLRLIAIYTGDTNNNRILEKVFNTFSKSYRERYELKRDAVRIESNHGLRIICLFKAHGVQLADARKDRQVKEKDLPERLQKEFALLAGGLLSNVALATIASIRDSTHHVLAKMAESMDAPYFHHRAILPMVSDAEEYSVDVVLSDLKNAVDKHGVGQSMGRLGFDEFEPFRQGDD